MVATPERLTPQQLVSKVDPDSPWRAWLFRSLAGAFAGVLTLIVFSWIGDTWALLIAVVMTALALWRSDGAGVHDLLSALWSRRAAGQSVTIPREHEISTVRVTDLRAGDHVCLADEVKKRMTEYERRVAESEASANRKNTARQEAYERRKKLNADRGSTVLPPSPEPPKPVPQPTVRYREVIAVRRERDRRIQIGFAGGQTVELVPEDSMSTWPRRAPVPKRDTERAARALEALLIELQGQPQPVSERHLVAMLITASHQRSAIRHALRAAVATRLISRHTGFRRFFGRIWRALAHGADNDWHGDDCELTLTHLGELWLTATPIPNGESARPPDTAP